MSKEGGNISTQHPLSADDTSDKEGGLSDGGEGVGAAIASDHTITSPCGPNENNAGENDQATSPLKPRELSRRFLPKNDGNTSQQSEHRLRSPHSGPNESNGQQHEYKNEFVFPDVPLPTLETLRLAHDQAKSFGEPSHQYQLTRAGTNLLSLQEVILPSIRNQTNSALKSIQAVAQRNVKDDFPDHLGANVIEATECCRRFLNKTILKAVEVAGESWRQREQRRAQSRLERHAAEVEQRRAAEIQARRERKNERAQAAKRRNIALQAELAFLEKALPLLKLVESSYNKRDTTAQVPLLEPMELDLPDVPSEDTADSNANFSPVMEESEVDGGSAQCNDNRNDMMVEEESDTKVSTPAERGYIFGAGDDIMLSHRARRQQNRMDVDSEEDESVENGCDDGNDFLSGDEIDTEEDSESSSSCIASGNLTESNELSSSRTSNVQRRTRARSMERALGQLSLQESSTSSPTRRSLSRGRTENGGSASTSTPVARRSQQITSPLLSPIEKESKRVQEGGDTTLDTVDLTDVCDDTVHYEEEEVSSSTSPSDAMIYNPSDKYDSVCPDSLEAILERLDVTIEELLKYPHVYRAVTTFDAEEIGPAIERASSTNAPNAQGLSDVAVEEEEEEEDVNEKENDYSPGSINRIDVDKLKNLPQDCAVLGLHAQLSKAMDENPPEGHAYFMQLLSECSERFQLAKPSTDYTKYDVVQELYESFTEEYNFLVLSKVGREEYVVKEPLFIIDESCTLSYDLGSIRSLLYKKLSNYPRGESRNFLANKLQGNLDYFEEMLRDFQHELGYKSAKKFTPHSKLSDEERKDPNVGADKYDSTLNMLKQAYPRPPTDPREGEETGPSSHLMPMEVAIIHRDIVEPILSLHNDYHNNDTWETITQRVRAENAIPSQLQKLFVRPDFGDSAPSCVGQYLIDLIKVLSQQCWMSGYKISECGSKEELSSLELDHILKYYRKSHGCRRFYSDDTTNHPNPFGLDDILMRALYETFKCRVTHFMWHPRGKSVPSEDLLVQRMCRELNLTYDDQVDKVLELFDGANSITFRQFCKIKEFPLFMLDWLSRGAFRHTKKPLVTYKALALAPMKLFHVSLEDIMKYTEAEYNQLNKNTRVAAVTNAVSTLMARLSGGCSHHEGRGCKLIRAEMNSGQLQAAMEMNHREEGAKDNNMTQLRYCPVKWCKEGIRGDCENECTCCHRKITAFQNGGPKPQGYTGRRR